jgi:hypothetical protein
VLLGSGSRRQAFLCFRAQVPTGWRRSHANLWLLAPADTFLQLSSPTAAPRLTHSLQLTSTATTLLNCLVRQVKVTLGPSVSRPVLLSSPIWGPRPDFCYCQTVTVLSMWGALSDERTGLSFVAVIISSTWHLYLQFYLSASYTVICHRGDAPVLPLPTNTPRLTGDMIKYL